MVDDYQQDENNEEEKEEDDDDDDEDDDECNDINEYLDMLIRINIHSRALETASPGTRVTRGKNYKC